MGAATFGWRSSNIGEIGQGRYLGSLRNCHPIDFISGFLRKGNLVITKVNFEAKLLVRMCTYVLSLHACIHSYIQVSNHVQVLLCFHGLRFVIRHGKAADDHKGWAKQTYMNVTESLVPDGLKLFKERSAAAARCVAVLVGNGGLVTWYSKGSGQYTEYSVDIGKQECSCGLWALYKYPCACMRDSSCHDAGLSA